MKRIILLLVPMLLLTACPEENEIKAMIEGLSERRATAIEVIDKENFDVENLLKAQEYFFDFSEKVHLLQVEPDALKDVQKLIKKNGAKNFCETFILPTARWQSLETFCASGEFYKCSPEIREYSKTYEKMLELVGKETAAVLVRERSCK